MAAAVDPYAEYYDIVQQLDSKFGDLTIVKYIINTRTGAQRARAIMPTLSEFIHLKYPYLQQIQNLCYSEFNMNAQPMHAMIDATRLMPPIRSPPRELSAIVAIGIFITTPSFAADAAPSVCCIAGLNIYEYLLEPPQYTFNIWNVAVLKKRAGLGKLLIKTALHHIYEKLYGIYTAAPAPGFSSIIRLQVENTVATNSAPHKPISTVPAARFGLYMGSGFIEEKPLLNPTTAVMMHNYPSGLSAPTFIAQLKEEEAALVESVKSKLAMYPSTLPAAAITTFMIVGHMGITMDVGTRTLPTTTVMNPQIERLVLGNAPIGIIETELEVDTLLTFFNRFRNITKEQLDKHFRPPPDITAIATADNLDKCFQQEAVFMSLQPAIVRNAPRAFTIGQQFLPQMWRNSESMIPRLMTSLPDSFRYQLLGCQISSYNISTSVKTLPNFYMTPIKPEESAIFKYAGVHVLYGSDAPVKFSYEECGMTGASITIDQIQAAITAKNTAIVGPAARFRLIIIGCGAIQIPSSDPTFVENSRKLILRRIFACRPHLYRTYELPFLIAQHAHASPDESALLTVPAAGGGGGGGGGTATATAVIALDDLIAQIESLKRDYFGIIKSKEEWRRRAREIIRLFYDYLKTNFDKRLISSLELTTFVNETLRGIIPVSAGKNYEKDSPTFFPFIVMFDRIARYLEEKTRDKGLFYISQDDLSPIKEIIESNWPYLSGGSRKSKTTRKNCSHRKRTRRSYK